jgi:uncharacterized protein YecT (DUF1311 family)
VPGEKKLRWRACLPQAYHPEIVVKNMLFLNPLKRQTIFLIVSALPLIMAIASCARAEEAPLPADGALLASCLSLVQKNREARGTNEPDELTEKAGAVGRLDAARDAAQTQPESCIGVVSTACIQAEGNMSTAAMTTCYEREANVWDARLNAAYQKLLANGDGEDVAEEYRKVQRTWMAFRDASCAQPAIVFKGTMAVPMSAYCRLEKTARQALWLGGWSQ